MGSLLKSRHLPEAAALLAVLLALPSLGAGWMLDDWLHRAILLEESRLGDLLGSPAEMFRFFHGDPERTGRLMDIGLYPWWTYPSLKAEFLQALTVLTHRLDYALWPDSPALMHAHSLLWLGAAVGLTTAYYRRLFGATRVAGIAALLFAVDDARGATVGFIANRNALVAATFGVSALIAHDRWRRDGSGLARLLAPPLLLAALFAKEEGIGTCAYLAAYGMFVDPRGRWRGLLALWPYAVGGVGWAALRASWGYGVHDLGLYIDPLTDTRRYLAAAAGRLPMLLLGQWGPIPADVAVVLRPPAATVVPGIAAAFLGLLLFAMTPLLRRDPLARFWATGMLLAAIPVSATLPGDRLLTFVGIGAAGLLAQFWRSVFAGDTPSNPPWRVTAKAAAWFLVAVHAVLAPLVLPLRAAHPIGPTWVEARLHVRLPRRSLEGRTVVVVNAPSAMIANYLVLRREMEGLSVPRHMRVLAPAIPSVTIRRLDERTLGIAPEGGYLRFPLDRVFRNEARGFESGDRVRLTGMTATIVSLTAVSLTADGRPAEATFRFDVPLESPSLLWLCFRGGGFEPFVPPAVGQEAEIDFDWKALLSPARPRSASTVSRPPGSDPA